jgi:hypothetical protein
MNSTIPVERTVTTHFFLCINKEPLLGHVLIRSGEPVLEYFYVKDLPEESGFKLAFFFKLKGLSRVGLAQAG